VRRAAIIVIVVSLGVSALVGIVTVLTGDFGEVQGKILLTTLLLAGFSITSLCHLAVVGRALRVVGFIGIGTSFVAFAAGASLIWRDWNTWDDPSELVLKTFFVGSILAASLAQANLLLLLGERRSLVIRVGLYATLAFIAALALLGILPILTDGGIPGDNGDPYARAVAVVAILDALGTIVVPVMSRFVRDEGSSGERHETLRINLDADAAARLDRIAAARGLGRDAVVAEAIAALEE
jgi:hypothetical protein